MIERAGRLLSQLPATAPDILDALPFDIKNLPEYEHEPVGLKTTRNGDKASQWKRLWVVHHVSNYVLRCALHAAALNLEGEISRPRPNDGPVIDSILVLLQLTLQISAEKAMHDAKWLIVCAFLWTSWQRSLMIDLWVCMYLQLDGFDYGSRDTLHRKGLKIVPDICVSRSRQFLEEFRRIPYLCGWAFQSLRNDRANIAMDLRHFHELYYTHFGERKPICNQGPEQCDGRSSKDCKRFKDSRAENQSVHDHVCEGSCQRLFWDRGSFTSISGPKAVDIVTTNSFQLRYCQVSKSTLTVSHVWSHGQGGRPDDIGPEGTGFNLCLHRRYADLATSLGCDSYWMDTPCIPSEPELRWECISQITTIFSTSGKTVICDRDIMTIDISSPTTRAYESVLAALLVCDWGIRAWTLLESIRGRDGLFVLCRYNILINLHQLITSVHDHGRVDLTNLFLTRDYLFPPVALSNFELFPGMPVTTELEREMEDGFVNIGTAAALLSHRHATRDGDDLLIWSLLIGDIEDDSPVAMWERQVGKRIPTGSLVSSAQRIENRPGLGWAPFSPTALQRLNEHNTSSRTYPAYDGANTSEGLITPEGLRAKWLVYVFPVTPSPSVDARKTQDSGLSQLCLDIAVRYLWGYRYGALLQTMPRSGPRHIPVAYHESLGQVLVVCGSLDEAVWEWKGIYECDAGVTLPPFSIKEILIS